MITRDPVDGISGATTTANPYHYVSNNPLNSEDPMGLLEQEATFNAPAFDPCSPYRSGLAPGTEVYVSAGVCYALIYLSRQEIAAECAEGILTSLAVQLDQFNRSQSLIGGLQMGWDFWSGVYENGIGSLTNYIPFYGSLTAYDQATTNQERCSALNQLGGEVAAATALARAVGNAKVAPTEVGGGLADINPTGGQMNCGSCAVALDNTLAGRPSSAIPGGPVTVTDVASAVGKSAKDWGNQRPTPHSIVGEMQNAGSGARGIVYGSPTNGSIGHFFNVVNQGGVVKFLDGQVGSVLDVAEFQFKYKWFGLLRTN